MEGRARAAKRTHEAQIAQAWHTERFAREERLQGLAHYLKRDRGSPIAADLIAGFEELKRQGVPMTIRKIERQP